MGSLYWLLSCCTTCSNGVGVHVRRGLHTCGPLYMYSDPIHMVGEETSKNKRKMCCKTQHLSRKNQQIAYPDQVLEDVAPALVDYYGHCKVAQEVGCDCLNGVEVPILWWWVVHHRG